MKIINKNNNAIIAEEVIVAKTILTRLKGLLGRKELRKNEALLLSPCNSIHTFFMRFPIDVLFLDRNNKIVKILSSFAPFRLSGIYFKAFSALELPAGAAKNSSTRENDIIQVI